MAHGSILPSPAVTSRQLSAVFCVCMPCCSAVGVTVSDSSDTYRRIGLDSEKLPWALCVCAARQRLPRWRARPYRCSPLDTDCNLPWLNRDITPHFSFLTTIVRQAPRVNPAGAPSVQALRAAPGRLSATGGTGDVRGEYAMRPDRRSHQGRKPGTVRSVRKLAAPRSPRGIYGGSVCVTGVPATEASWGRTAPDVRGGRANGARPSQSQAG